MRSDLGPDRMGDCLVAEIVQLLILLTVLSAVLCVAAFFADYVLARFTGEKNGN